MLRIAFSMSTEEVVTAWPVAHSSGMSTEFAFGSSGCCDQASTFALALSSCSLRIALATSSRFWAASWSPSLAATANHL
ncbi:Uncharacterised protein [Mycobacterium tuberculosis]|nr:Uncharacterised protein [Mycobacterium tuberculosis]